MSEPEVRYDVAIVSQRFSQRVSPQGVRAVVQFMSASGYIGPALQTEGRGWLEVHARPGDFAHSLFHDGSSTGVDPVFYEMGFRFGDQKLDLGYVTEEPVYFFLELRGAAFDQVTDAFLERIYDILYVRPAVAARLHDGLRAREVDEDGGSAAPESSVRKRRDRTDGRIGTSVEEF